MKNYQKDDVTIHCHGYNRMEPSGPSSFVSHLLFLCTLLLSMACHQYRALLLILSLIQQWPTIKGWFPCTTPLHVTRYISIAYSLSHILQTDILGWGESVFDQLVTFFHFAVYDASSDFSDEVNIMSAWNLIGNDKSFNKLLAETEPLENMTNRRVCEFSCMRFFSKTAR